jgi:hypothetical protein
MKVDTRPANGEDVDWLADVFTRSMREAITAARGSWDFEREDAQFRAQLQIADTRVIRMEGTDVGLVTVRALDGNCWRCTRSASNRLGKVQASARA